LGLFVWQNRAVYQQKYQGEAEFSYYQNSRYVRGDKSNYLPSDSQVYALKGYLFVVKKLDQVNFEPGHPPLASYFMGLSILIFGNPTISNILFGLATLIIFYLLALEITKHKTLAALLTLFLFSEPLFRGQLTESLLDIYQLFFVLVATLFYVKWLRLPNFKLIALSQTALGLALASKFFLSGLPVLFALFLPTVFTGNFRRFTHHVAALAFVPLGFMVGHLTYFFFHPSLLEFARYQRYVLNWWAGSPQIAPFAVWDLIFANRWHTWWDNQAIIAASEWRFTWPLTIGLGLISLPILIFRKKK
ncbi:MAG: glycosyltransferase family 39 protein, partial [Microgenomates group bacterium]